ncbi:hypothetical protein TSTA_016970 [Talaromyces stipitatus ATCC 10500]|uniref:HAT C-terminal dimerisation domain-containing protein n=1 Tax=Talaromyces stipitatus (strain ATCC 10500 / CBS 375.48 / QM 6759 / NRRL 1006) TaxID=441959 RepID=B8MEJ4_TALSN|nr:uncharacterized protein TSTA_016970 [Talaromyces stipitatus ATCC 10500]EED16621.1 hypothetical protein TSTA_016970 [Talaromyces stipitatus ATCC 10500]
MVTFQHKIKILQLQWKRQSLGELSDVESRMLKEYFETPPVGVIDTTGNNWLCNWWRIRKDEYRQMAAVARNYLAIPASEVAVKKLFSAARDVLAYSGEALTDIDNSTLLRIPVNPNMKLFPDHEQTPDIRWNRSSREKSVSQPDTQHPLNPEFRNSS